ncbi:uncharacterized protein METZ01_LOCUS148663, partial [marine metagenome]
RSRRHVQGLVVTWRRRSTPGREGTPPPSPVSHRIL